MNIIIIRQIALLNQQLGIALSAAELAALIGVPADALEATVTRYNDMVAGGVDTDVFKMGANLDKLDRIDGGTSFVALSVSFRYFSSDRSYSATSRACSVSCGGRARAPAPPRRGDAALKSMPLPKTCGTR